MGLTPRKTDSIVLSSQEEPQLKYSYRFRVEAKKPGVFDDAEMKAEVQTYINELLGIKEKSANRTN